MTTTDWRGLCEELVDVWKKAKGPEYEARRSLSNFGLTLQPLIARARAALAQPEPEVVGPTDEELESFLVDVAAEHGDIYWADPLVLARAVLARWGRPAPVPAGEVAELVAWLRANALTVQKASGQPANGAKQRMNRAADLLEQRQAALVPVASDTRYEFSVLDADCIEQAGGSAPTYAQALSEGQHYLAQYLQDGPHILELRRVEVLPAHALPLPSGEVEA